MGQILGGVSVLKITEATNPKNKLGGSISVTLITERGEEDAAITESSLRLFTAGGVSTREL